MSQTKILLMQKKHTNIFGLLIMGLLFLSVLQGCKKGVSLSETDFKDMYSSKSDVPQPRFKIFHAENSTSEVYYMFENRGLKYSINEVSGDYMAKARISWQLYTDYSSTEIIDSSSFVKFDSTATSGLFQLQGKFTIPAKADANYVLKITTTDLNTTQKTVTFHYIDKTDKTNRQFFKVVLEENNSVLFRNYFYENERLSITYALSKSLTQLEGKFFDVIFPVAAPPFSMSNPKPFDFDNHTEFSLDMTNGIAHFSSADAGIYHFGLGGGNKYTGLTLYQYSNEFPEVNTNQELLSPLRFITSKKEFAKLRKYQEPKKAVDEFWKSTSKDPKKAKKLIKGYYNRVQNANYFFSSFKEGWKTDRGVIYIVFGPPSIVYRSLTGESWTYGEDSNYRSLTFNFVKVKNPFTNNDFALQRTSVYKNPWYRAVDAWRQGKVASLEY